MSSTNVAAVVSKYELLKKAWEGKKLDDAGKLLTELKIGLMTMQDNDRPVNERVSSRLHIKKQPINRSNLGCIVYSGTVGGSRSLRNWCAV
jgi:hypothetical protein